MSLYKWLVDYVFIPLGGSRKNPPRVYLNVLITMFLSGLWHGAGLNFIVWGLWHGLLLAGHRFWRQWSSSLSTTLRFLNERASQPSSALALAIVPGTSYAGSRALLAVRPILSLMKAAGFTH